MKPAEAYSLAGALAALVILTLAVWGALVFLYRTERRFHERPYHPNRLRHAAWSLVSGQEVDHAGYTLTRAEVDGVPVLLLIDGDQVYAVIPPP